MTYYFSLRNDIVEKFVSSSGGRVILTNHTGSKEYFKCIFIRKNDTQTIYTIDLEYTEYLKYVTNDGYISLTNGLHGFASAQLHACDIFDGNVEESYHYYHFAVPLREKLILTNGGEEPIKSIRILNILSANRKTVELPVSSEALMCRPDGTIFYKYSVRLPDKYLESFLINRESFMKILYLSDNAMYNQSTVIVTMYRSINGPKGLKDSMGLEVRKPSLKNMWQPEAKPWNWISTKPECNINVETFFPKDFIPPYSVADSRISMLEVFKEMSMFESDKRVKIPEIKEVIFNKPATVVYWKDGSKTVVKCGKDEPFDREKAVAMCFIKKMLKPSKKCHWLDVIHDAIKVAEEKEQRKAEAKDAKVIKEATNKAKAEQAKKNTAELQAAIQKLETKSLEEMNSKVEGKDEFEEKYKDVPVKASKNEVSEEYAEKIFDQAVKENKKWAEQANNKGKKNKIDVDVMVDCIKEDLTIDEIAEMNSWDKAAVARIYYKITGTKPEKKSNTYSELDALFEQGVSIDAATRRTGFSKNIVAMRYAKLQNKKNKE